MVEPRERVTLTATEDFIKKLSKEPKKLEQIFNFIIGYRVVGAGQKDSFCLKKIRQYYETLYLESLIHQLEKENKFFRFSPRKIIEEICDQLISSQEVNDAWAIQFFVAHYRADSSLDALRSLSQWQYTPIIFETVVIQCKAKSTHSISIYESAKEVFKQKKNESPFLVYLAYFLGGKTLKGAVASTYLCISLCEFVQSNVGSPEFLMIQPSLIGLSITAVFYFLFHTWLLDHLSLLLVVPLAFVSALTVYTLLLGFSWLLTTPFIMFCCFLGITKSYLSFPELFPAMQEGLRSELNSCFAQVIEDAKLILSVRKRNSKPLSKASSQSTPQTQTVDTPVHEEKPVPQVPEEDKTLVIKKEKLKTRSLVANPHHYASLSQEIIYCFTPKFSQPVEYQPGKIYDSYHRRLFIELWTGEKGVLLRASYVVMLELDKLHQWVKDQLLLAYLLHIASLGHVTRSQERAGYVFVSHEEEQQNSKLKEAIFKLKNLHREFGLWRVPIKPVELIEPAPQGYPVLLEAGKPYEGH